MPLTAETALLAAAFGSLVGLILALTGAGGGIIAVPLLVFGMHLSMQQAAPIGLLAVGLSSTLGAFLGWREGLLRYRAAALIGGAGMLCAPFGVWLAQRLPHAPLLASFAAVLMWTAILGWRRARQGVAETEEAPRSLPCQIDPTVGRIQWNLPCARALAGTGLMSGILSGLLGVGGGFVIVPALRKYSDLPARGVLVTSMGVIALVAVGGVSSAIVQKTLDWAVAGPFALGALIGLLIGQGIAKRVRGQRLQEVFAILCMGVSLLMLARAAGLMH